MGQSIMRTVTAFSIIKYRKPPRKPFISSSVTIAVATGRYRDGAIEVVHLSHGGNEWVAMDDITRVKPYKEAIE